MNEEAIKANSTIKTNALESNTSNNQPQGGLKKHLNQRNVIAASEKQFKLQTEKLLNNEDIKHYEHQLIAKDKTISELEISLKLKSEETLVLQQETAHLKLENKKLSLSINSPGKVITFLTKQFKTQNDASTQNLMKDKAQLKETNDKLLLILAEKEAEICQLKESYESRILSTNNTIYTLNAKIRDLSNDLEDINLQLNEKCKEMDTIEERGILLSKYNCLKEEYEQFKTSTTIRSAINNDTDDIHSKASRLEERNKALEERVNKLEKEYVEWLSTGKISGTSVDQLEFHVTLINGLRSQLGICEDEIHQLENQLKGKANRKEKSDNDYKLLEAKYNETLKQLEAMNNKYIQSEQYFLKGSSSLNREIANLLNNNLEMNHIKEELENRVKGLLTQIKQLKTNFKSLQDTMTALREKDDYDITLIEERYIVLESILQTDKAELLQQNRDLLNKIKAIEMNANSQGNNSAFLHDQEIKILKEENRLLQFRIKEQEKTISLKEKLYEENMFYQSEIKLMKSDIKELKDQYEKIKQGLISKTIELTNELAESRKRTSLLRSKSNMYMSASVLQTNELDKNKSNEGNNDNSSKKHVKNNTIDALERELFLLKKQREQEMKEHKEEIEAIENKSATIKSELTALSYENEVELLNYKNRVKQLMAVLVKNKIDIKNK